MRRGVVIVIVSAAVSLGGVGSADANLPGTNGPIVFNRYLSHATMQVDADGTNLALRALPDRWSPGDAPDGLRRIIGETRTGPGGAPMYDLFVENRDGSNRHLLEIAGQFPSWSPDCSRVVYSSGTPSSIFVARADGTDARQLTSGSSDYRPDWSPDGTKIAWIRDRTGAHIWTMNPDGSGQEEMPGQPASRNVSDFTYSPDGQWFAMSSNFFTGIAPSPGGGGAYDVLSIRTTGTNLTRLTVSDYIDQSVRWQPVTAYSGSCPLPSLAISHAGASGGKPTAFDASGSSYSAGTLSYSWAFGDGGTAVTPTPSHTYRVPGTYTVTLSGTDKVGRSGTTTQSVLVANSAPEPLIDGLPPTPFLVAGKSIAFSARSSVDPDGSIVAYAWNFGDGTTATTPSVAHTFASPGLKTISLTTTDDLGLAATVTRSVAITPDPLPIVTITASSSRRAAGGALDFSAEASDANGRIDSYEWDFGDGRTALGASASHTFSAPGAYTVTAVATDDDGNRGSTSHQVEIVAPMALRLTSPADGSTFITSPRYLTWESADGDGTALPVTITVQPVPPGSLPAVGLTQVFEAVSSHTAGSGATELPSLPRGTYFWWVSKTLEGEASSPVRSFSVGPDLEIGRATKLGTTSLKIATTKLRSGTIEIKTPASKQSAALAFKFAHPESQYGTAERAVQWTCANAGKHTVRVTGKTSTQTTIQRTTSFVTPTCGRRFKGALADNRRIRTTKQSITLRMTDKWKSYGEKYRVCITGPTRRCFRRTTNSSGKNTVHAGHLPKGRYRAKWSVAGRTYASWRFRVKVPYVPPPAPPAWSCTSFECRVALRYAIGMGRILAQQDRLAIGWGGRCLSQSGANRFDCDAIVKRRGGGLGFAGQFAVYRCFYGLSVTVGRYGRGPFTGGVTSDSRLANCPRYH